MRSSFSEQFRAVEICHLGCRADCANQLRLLGARADRQSRACSMATSLLTFQEEHHIHRLILDFTELLRHYYARTEPSTVPHRCEDLINWLGMRHHVPRGVQEQVHQ